jgi:hypothetical protein
MLARDVMSSPVITLRPDVPAHAAAALLVSHGFTGARWWTPPVGWWG